MELGWLESIIYGLVSGFAEFLPISSRAQQSLFFKLLGKEWDPISSLAVHIGMVLAVLFSCTNYISKLSRERRIAATPRAKRKRQPELKAMLDLRLLRIAGVPLVLFFAAYPFVRFAGDQLWLLALAMIVNGILLFLPPYFPSANKDSLTLSGWDGFLIGAGCGLGVIPGISWLGGALTTAQLRGADRRYALDFVLLLAIPATVLWIGFDIYGIATAAQLQFHLLKFLIAGAAAFGGGCAGIFCMRFLSVRSGFSGFSYYCWGAALLALILYLLT